MSTTFTTIHTDEHIGEWPESWEEVTTRVDGDLADKVRTKVGAAPDAEVQIFERGTEGGWSEYTVEWHWDFTVEVAGIGKVWSTDGYSEVDFSDDPKRSGNALGRFVSWLGA